MVKGPGQNRMPYTSSARESLAHPLIPTAVGTKVQLATMTRSTLDLSLFTHGNEVERQQLASNLLENLSQHGFVVLINHGISDSTVRKLFEWVCMV